MKQYKKRLTNETKSWFFVKINKSDKPLARLIKKKENIKMIKFWNGTITTNLTKLKRIIRKCYEQLYASKIGNLCEMDKFLGRHELPKPTQVEVENLGRPITSEKIKLAIKKSISQKEKPRSRWLSW